MLSVLPQIKAAGRPEAHLKIGVGKRQEHGDNLTTISHQDHGLVLPRGSGWLDLFQKPASRAAWAKVKQIY